MSDTKIVCKQCGESINSKAKICPHCKYNFEVYKNRIAFPFIAGFSLIGCGTLLVWIPFIGIPLILLGVLFSICSLVIGIVLIVLKITRAEKYYTFLEKYLNNGNKIIRKIDEKTKA